MWHVKADYEKTTSSPHPTPSPSSPHHNLSRLEDVSHDDAPRSEHMWPGTESAGRRRAGFFLLVLFLCFSVPKPNLFKYRKITKKQGDCKKCKSTNLDIRTPNFKKQANKKFCFLFRQLFI